MAALIAGSWPLAQPFAQEPSVTAEPAGEPVPFSDEPSLLYATS